MPGSTFWAEMGQERREASELFSRSGLEFRHVNVLPSYLLDSHSGECYRNLAGKQSLIISSTDSHFDFALEKLGKVGKELDML